MVTKCFNDKRKYFAKKCPEMKIAFPNGLYFSTFFFFPFSFLKKIKYI
jgi:hypothetical protein